MPASTPIYAFPYPCPGEVVTSTSFMNLANAIDTKMQDVVVDETLALNRYNVRLTGVPDVANVGVIHVTVGANSSYVLPVGGLWIVSAFTVNHLYSGTNDPTAQRLRVQQNAVSRFGMMQKPGQGSNVFSYMTTTGLIVGTAGDVLTTEILFAGPPATFTYTMILEAKLVIRIA